MTQLLYEKFFGFSRRPFDLEIDLDSLFMPESRKELIAALIFAINGRKGFISITGETGTGKTTLLRYLQTVLDEKIKTIYLSEFSIFFKDFLQEILQKLGVPVADGSTPSMMHQLNTSLLQMLERGENLVILVDEAQNLSKQAFEELRMLSELETGEFKLLQIVLAGQPALETLLDSGALRPLGQKMWVSRRLRPLSAEESRRYIEHCLQKAGKSTDEVFSPEAVDLIVRNGGGLFPDLMNLCDRTFLTGYVYRKRRIDAVIVQEVLKIQEAGTPKAAQPPPEVSPEKSDSPRLLARLPSLDRLKPGRIRIPRAFFESRNFFFLAALGLGLGIYLLWESLSSISPPQTPKPAAPPAVVAQKPELPPPVEKVEPPAKPVVPPAEPKKTVMTESSRPPADVPAPPKKPQGEPKPEEKPPAIPMAKAPSIPPAKVQVKKEEKPELKAGVKAGVRFNEEVEVPKGAGLFALAREYYQQGNPTLVDLILESNPKITNMNQIPKGQKVKIPEIQEETLLHSTPDGFWKIHLGTFGSQKALDRYKDEPLLKGNEIRITERKVGPDTIWYRHYAEKFATREKALQTIQGLRKKGLLPALKKE